MKTLNTCIAPLLFLLFSLHGCTPGNDKNASGPILATDDLGRTIALPRPPSRIVSLAPSITETLFALGLDSSIAGVTEFCDFPEGAGNKPTVGGILNPNIERIAALEPDLIVMSVSGNARSDFDKLTELHYGVFVTNPKSIEGVFKSIRDLGAVTGRAAEAESLVARLQSERDTLVNWATAKAKPSVVLLLSLSPVIAAGPGSFLDELLSLAHATNAAGNAPTGFPMLSREEILRFRPDVLLATSDIAERIDQVVSTYPEWKSLKAAQQGRVAIVDADVVTRPGPRIIEGLRNLVLAIHWSQRSTAARP